MDEVRKPINSVCYTPSSEPYRIYFLNSYLETHKHMLITITLLVVSFSRETWFLIIQIVGKVLRRLSEPG
jgi:hypothetical protein